MADRGRNVIDGTPMIWADAARVAAGTATDLMTLITLTTGTGQVGTQHDLGVKHRVKRYKWRLTVQFNAAPVIGEIIEVWVATAESGAAAAIDGGVDVADAAVLVDDLRNCMQIGTLSVTSINADHDMSASGVVELLSRYVSPIIWNATANDLRTPETNHEFTLTPMIEQDFEK